MSKEKIKNRTLTSFEKRTFYVDIFKLTWDTKFSKERLEQIHKDVQQSICLLMSKPVHAAYLTCPQAMLKGALPLYPAPVNSNHGVVIGDIPVAKLVELVSVYVKEAREIQNLLYDLDNDIKKIGKLHDLMDRFPQFEKFWPQNKPRKTYEAPVPPVVKKVVPSEVANKLCTLLG